MQLSTALGWTAVNELTQLSEQVVHKQRSLATVKMSK